MTKNELVLKFGEREKDLIKDINSLKLELSLKQTILSDQSNKINSL
jgi:hypothetical protein